MPKSGGDKQTDKNSEHNHSDFSPRNYLHILYHSLRLDKELAKINEWLEINKLSLNVTKTKFMVFHTQHKHRAIKPPVPKINNTNIEKVE